MNDTEQLTKIIELIIQAGALVTLAVISYQNFRQERARVREIQELRVTEQAKLYETSLKSQAEIYEKRIEDQRRMVDALTAMLNVRPLYANSSKPVTDLTG